MRSLFAYIIFLSATIYSYGQVALYTVVEDKDYKVNQRLTVTFILRISGSDQLQETPLRLPDSSKFNVIGSASDQNSYVDPEKKVVINQTVYQWFLEPRQAGKVRIGSALVDVSGKTYKTEPIDIVVKEGDKVAEKSSVANGNEVYLNLEVQNKNVYENQPAKAVLRVYSKDFNNFRKVSNIQFVPNENVEIQAVSFAKSDIEPSDAHTNWASQVVAVYMIFPNESGKIDVPAVSASFTNADKASKIVSNRVKLNVKVLPKGSPVNYKNAVGNFALRIFGDNSTEDVEVGKPLNINVKVSGEGNFNTVHLPRLATSPDYTFYEPNVSQFSNAGQKAIQGEVTAHYVVIPKKAGKINIRTERFSFFNPDQRKYVDIGARSLTVEAMTPEEIASAKTAIEKVNDYTNNVLEKVNTPVLRTSKLKLKDTSNINWSAVLVNLVLIFGAIYAALFYRRYNILRKKKIITLQSLHKPVGSVAETENELREKLDFDLDAHFSYLGSLLREKGYSGFFTAVDDLETEFLTYVNSKNYHTISQFIEAEKGFTLAEQYRLLQRQLEVEKYSPHHSGEHMEEIFGELQHVYSTIVK